MQNHTYCITKVFNPFPDCTSGSDTTVGTSYMFSRTHEFTNKLISKAPRSNHQATKRTHSVSVNRRKFTKHKPEKNHNFDFFLKQFVWIFTLNEELAKISTKSTRINKRAKFGNSFPKTSKNRTTQFPGQGKSAQRGQGYRRLGFDSNVM
ncbi:hypothetical protein GQ457_05G020880 [Hibiscus cannabinus]